MVRIALVRPYIQETTNYVFLLLKGFKACHFRYHKRPQQIALAGQGSASDLGDQIRDRVAVDAARTGGWSLTSFKNTRPHELRSRLCFLLSDGFILLKLRIAPALVESRAVSRRGEHQQGELRQSEA